MFQFAGPFQNPVGSPIRELFKHLSEPGMISFAGGYPAPSTFDLNILSFVQEAFEKSPTDCLQYSATEGQRALREALSKFMSTQGIDYSPEQVLVTSGSQQAFDFIIKVFVEPGSTVMVEAPTYSAALQALRLAGADIKAIPTDDDGLIPEFLEQYLESCSPVSKPRLLYLVPTFSNPAARSLSAPRRLKLLELIAKYDIVVVEDDPYSSICFEGERPQSLVSMAKDPSIRDRVIYLSSLSKVIAPGLRIGWLAAHPDIVRRVVIAKQTSDMCSAPWLQNAVAAYMNSGLLEDQIRNVVSAYEVKRDAMVSHLRARLGDNIKFSTPKGGMFIWASLADDFDSAELLKYAIKQKVMFVPGSSFYIEHPENSTLRLSFATPTVDEIVTGVSSLASAFEQMKAELAR